MSRLWASCTRGTICLRLLRSLLGNPLFLLFAFISLSVIRGISPCLKYSIPYKCSQVPFSQVANTCETRYDVIIGTESKSHKEGSRIPEQVELGNRIHQHKTSENKQKEKKEETAPAQNYKYIRDFYSVLQQTRMVSLWCTYGELGDLSPPSPIRSVM